VKNSELMSCTRIRKDGTHPDRVPLIPKVREYVSAEPDEQKGRCACCDSQSYLTFVFEIGIGKAHALHPRRLHEAVEGDA